MGFGIEKTLRDALGKRQAAGLLRELRLSPARIDFSSNDYLGISKNIYPIHAEQKLPAECLASGSTGSRLLTGHSERAAVLERRLAISHGAEAALLFNSGYQANLGLFQVLLGEKTILFYDEQIHASVRDGIRLGKGRSFPFYHNDLNHLEKRLKRATKRGDLLIAVESVYSMDGDLAPLAAIADLAEKYQAALIVDEAHATGIFGAAGRGRIFDLGLTQRCFACVMTFGKAVGYHGALVLGPQVLKDYLVNFSRPLIYTTMMPPRSLETLDQLYTLTENAHPERDMLHGRIQIFSRVQEETKIPELTCHPTPIQTWRLKKTDLCKKAAQVLESQGFDVRPILSPTVRKGEERIRICLHAFNTDQEIMDLFTAMARFSESFL